MKILFSTFGSLGDIHPYIAVALEARARGHEPVLATSPKYRAKIEQLGIEFRPIRPDLPDKEEFSAIAQQVMNLKSGPQYLFEQLLSAHVRDAYADLLVAGEDVELIVTHPAMPAGPIAAHKLGKKWISSALAPISFWSKQYAPVPPTIPQLDILRLLGPIWSNTVFAVARSVTRRWIREIDALRSEVGLDVRQHPVFEGQFSPFGTLALFSPHFAPPQSYWPTNTQATGFCFYDAEGYEAKTDEAQDDWRVWMAQGEAPVVATLGSAAAYGAGDFYSYWQRVMGERHRLLLLAPQMESSESEDLLTIRYAPYSAIFSLAKAVIHQGGIGTTAQALRAGVPQIIWPFAHDQPDNAVRIQRLGVGKAFFPSRSNSLARGEKVLAHVLGLEAKAQSLGDKISAENGPSSACEFLEKQL